MAATAAHHLRVEDVSPKWLLPPVGGLELKRTASPQGTEHSDGVSLSCDQSPSFRCLLEQVTVGGGGKVGEDGVQLVTFALWEPKVRCPGFVLTLLLHLLRTCLCVQGSSDGAAGDGERDSEDGHLIYKSGDVIEDRCTSQVDQRVVAPHGRSNLTAINLLFRPDRGHVGGGNLWEGGAVFGPQQVKRSARSHESVTSFAVTHCLDRQRRETGRSEDHQEPGEIQGGRQSGDQRPGEDQGERS